jgi:DamX protein
MQDLGLTVQPFNPPQECEELFHATSIDMLTNSIKQQLLSNDMVQLVIGEHHSGKSCFCRRLLCETPPQLVIYYHQASRKSRIDDLFKTMLAGNQLDKAGNAQILAVQAAKLAFRQLRDQQQPVLLIDDAHLLSAPVLRMLFRFLDAVAKQNRGKIKTVLIGERKLQENWGSLGKVAPADESIYTSLLRPLNHQEVAKFLSFRFAPAGVTAHPFSAKQLQIIQRDSAGLPGKIEQLACDLLNNSQLGFRQRLLRKPLLSGVALVAAIAMVIALSMPNWRDKSGLKRMTADPAAPAMTLPATRPVVADANPGENRRNQNTQTPADEAGTKPYITPLEDEPGSLLSENNTGSDTVPINIAAADPGGTEKGLSDDEQAVQTTINEKTNDEKIEDNSGTILRDADWLKQWPDDYYVVQLAGFWQNDKLMQLAESIDLEKDLIYLTSLRNDKPWHILLYGVFPDRSTARSAILRLPAELRQLQPWPRPVSALVRRLD